MTAIADLLNAEGYPVYLPHRDGMEFRHILQVLEQQGWAATQAGQFLHAAIFALDIFQLVEECQAVVWNLNGRVPDEGAVSEAAMAWMLGKPLVAYKEDVRSMITGRDNPLLVGLVDFETVRTFDAIAPMLASVLPEPTAPPAPIGQLPARVRLAVKRGRELWQAMNDSSATGDNVAIAEEVVKLFAETEPRADALDAAITEVLRVPGV